MHTLEAIYAPFAMLNAASSLALYQPFLNELRVNFPYFAVLFVSEWKTLGVNISGSIPPDLKSCTNSFHSGVVFLKEDMVSTCHLTTARRRSLKLRLQTGGIVGLRLPHLYRYGAVSVCIAIESSVYGRQATLDIAGHIAPEIGKHKCTAVSRSIRYIVYMYSCCVSSFGGLFSGHPRLFSYLFFSFQMSV